MVKAVEDGCAPFSRLPDDIVIQIYNKVMDLKTLCRCQLISKHLGSTVFQADTLSYNVPLRFDYEDWDRLEEMEILMESFICNKKANSAGALDSNHSFLSAIKFIERFTKLKSICIQFPSYINVVSGVSCFKWKFKFGTRAELPTEADTSAIQLKNRSCLKDVADRLDKVFGCIVEFPLLENLCIMNSNERGVVTRIRGQGDKLRNFLHSYGTRKYRLTHYVEYFLEGRTKQIHIINITQYRHRRCMGEVRCSQSIPPHDGEDTRIPIIYQ